MDGRFEHIVLSCNATSDHAIIWIERESQSALDVSSQLVPLPATIPGRQMSNWIHYLLRIHIENFLSNFSLNRKKKGKSSS